MHMKFFTLTAVCVLIFGLMIVLGGITTIPGTVQEREYNGHQGKSKEIRETRDQSNPGATSPGFSEIDPRGNRAPVIACETAKETSFFQNRHIRILGMLFILGWIIVSVRLISAD